VRLALVLLAACGPSILTVPTGTGTGTDYPCGVNGLSCGNHLCCDPPASECGPTPSCGIGECCGMSDDGSGFARRKLSKQRPEHG
jgi:hypothetical protein